jgi:general stress protein CsbA
MDKRLFYVLTALNIILLFINLYVGYTRNNFNFLNIFSNIFLVIGLYLLSKKQK